MKPRGCFAAPLIHLLCQKYVLFPRIRTISSNLASKITNNKISQISCLDNNEKKCAIIFLPAT